MAGSLIVGTAGWTVPRQNAPAFAENGTALERYASRFRGVEINSSFHRPHRPSTWARWAESVPNSFRFAVKIPKTITHQQMLADCGPLLEAFLAEAGCLGPKLAVLLVQLPPKLAFDEARADAFFRLLRSFCTAAIACEPRHASWFEPEADSLLRERGIARVAADPAVVPAAARPGGCRNLSYWRLHGSPAMYRSPYGAQRIRGYADTLGREHASGREVWCMFDNTASSAATGDALLLAEMLRQLAS